MYKIEIDWGFKSPHLRVLTGTVRVDSISIGMINKKENPGFPVKKEQNQLGYRNCPAMFQRCKPLVDLMVRSYFDGMNLSDLSIEWFKDCYRTDYEVVLKMND